MSLREYVVPSALITMLLLAGCGAPIGTGTPTVDPDPGPTASPSGTTAGPTTASPTPTTPSDDALPPGVHRSGRIDDVGELMAANRAGLRESPFRLSFRGYQESTAENFSFRIQVVQGDSQRYIAVEQNDDIARKWERDRASALRDFGASKYDYEDSAIELEASSSLEFEQYYHPQFIADYFEMGAFRYQNTTVDEGRSVVTLTADSVDPTFNGSSPQSLSVTARVASSGIIRYFDVKAVSENETVEFTHRVTDPESPVEAPTWMDSDVTQLNATVSADGDYLAINHRRGPAIENGNLSVFRNTEKYEQLNRTAGSVADTTAFTAGDTLYLAVSETNQTYQVHHGINTKPDVSATDSSIAPQQLAVLIETDSQRVFVAPVRN